MKVDSGENKHWLLGLSGGEAGEERGQRRYQEPDGFDAQQVHYHWWIGVDEWFIQLDQTGDNSFLFVCF